jgi:FkbM family methyltransferase
MRYYGQKTKHENEFLDKYVHQKFIKNKFTNGSFLEMGAVNGVQLSNTKFFEDNMGFNQGVLIEADPEPFKTLQSNRPNCECFNYAVHSEKKEVEFLTHKNPVLGCVNHEESKFHRDTFHEHKRGEGKSFKKILPAERLDVILRKTKIKYIDFWSLDVEGSELQCFNSMDWSIPVGLICVESTANTDAIHNIMVEHGFTLIDQRGGDSFYFNFNYFRRDMFSIEEK